MGYLKRQGDVPTVSYFASVTGPDSNKDCWWNHDVAVFGESALKFGGYCWWNHDEVVVVDAVAAFVAVVSTVERHWRNPYEAAGRALVANIDERYLRKPDAVVFGETVPRAEDCFPGNEIPC